MASFPPAEMIAYVKGYQKGLSDWNLVPGFPLYLKILRFLHYFKSSIYQALGIGEQFYPAVGTAVLPLLLLIVRYFRNNESMQNRLVRVTMVMPV